LAFVPLRRSTDDERVLEFIGGTDLTDYLGPVCDPADEMDIGTAVGAWLVDGADGCAAVDFRFLPPGSAFASALERKLEGSGCKVLVEPDGVVARLDLAQSWNEQLGLLASKQRHEVSRKQRRFEKLTGIKPSIRRSDKVSLPADVDSFVALHRQSRGRKAQFFVPTVSEFFQDVASRYAERGELALEFLEVDGKPLAATLSFERDGQKFLYNMAYDSTASRLSPGIVLLSELIRQEIDAGSHTFDLLRGDEDYKRRLGARMQPLIRIRAELFDN
jgi:CelD/BcsL family acetyltransferase involved in cellulose biosynthesis